MNFGISSSCFYPENVEDGFKTVGELGAKTAELFVNSPSEMNPPIMTELKSIRDFYGIDVRTLHACTSGFETFVFFSGYKRRLYDGVEFYKKYFAAANEIGAKYVVFHGALERKISPEYYAECYSLLHNAAREQGVYIAHENVRDHLCCRVDFMERLADLIGDEFRMVLDIKQCRRSGESEFEFIRRLGNKIVQVHLSDCTEGRDCIAPGCGNYDFKKLLCALNDAGYNESALIELYRNNYNEPQELKEALEYLNSIA